MPTFYIKVVFFCIIGGVVLFAYISLRDFADIKLYGIQSGDVLNSLSAISEVSNRSYPIKYILQWTRPDTQPFVFMGVGQQGFIDRKCAFTNCFVTSDRNLLSDVTEYDVILFHGPELVYVPILNSQFPKKRSPRQKYVFASMESADYYPICSDRLDGFFNWTWSYKLDSDARWGYLLVKDSNNIVIGPNKIMHWMKLEDMEPMSEEFRKKIKSKSKAAAWFVSNCDGRSGRSKFANQLKKELEKYNLVLDVFGKCGTMKCGLEHNKDCDELVSDTYYFYLAFENSFSEDYVTEKLLRALQNDAVPVVFGGANYTRWVLHIVFCNYFGTTIIMRAKTIKTCEQ